MRDRPCSCGGVTISGDGGMNDSANLPETDRPPATSDFIAVKEADELTRQTTIGKLKIPTDVLRAYTMVFALIAIWIFFHYSTGQIFLSVGSVVGLAGGISAIVLGWLGFGLVPSIAAGIAMAVAIGAVQGALVAYVNIPAFIVTLG